MSTPRLGLPLLLPAQAQKHVTHNEALARIDLLLQAVLEATGAEVPPGAPAEGAAWGLGAAPTAAWAGQAGALAQWRDGGWLFTPPAEGWLVWDRAAGMLRVHDGGGWIGLGGTLDLQGIAGLGIAATWDATNRLAVSAAATLLNHAGAGHQLKLNKAAAGDTASLLFQTGFSGRAEMGLAGSDDFDIKVSPDGSGWTAALSLDRTTGAVAAPVGLTVAGQMAFTRGNILGAVAQSAGIPTGAAMERGSNADGDYARFADGTQICVSPLIASGAVTTAAGAVFTSGSLSWTYPAAFAAGTRVGASGGAGNANRWLGIGAAGITGVFFQVYAHGSAGSSSDVRLVATGRWF